MTPHACKIVLSVLFLWAANCAAEAGAENRTIPFKHSVLEDRAYGHRAIGDVDGNDLPDIVAVNEEDGGTRLAWYEYPRWEKHLIIDLAEQSDFQAYRACDLELGDVDGDGDLDAVGRIGKAGGDVEGVNVWLENPLPDGDPSAAVWKRHDIGETVYVKDVEIADFDGDGRMDVVCRTHETLHYYIQQNPDAWRDIQVSVHPKEGMEQGDVDRDGDPDIVLGGYWVETPSSVEDGEWALHTIDPKWFDQNTNDWRDNCCKVAVGDMNGDGCLDVLFSHSEKPGYPVSWHQAPPDPKTGEWIEHVIGRIDYCHNLKAFDFDLDGDQDVLAGEMPRYDAPYPVMLFINQGDSLTWKTQMLTDRGNYSIQAGDLGSDGDVDIVGLRRWDQTPMEIWENLTSDRKWTLDAWTYIHVDDTRGKWGDWDKPDWLRYFGVTMRDLTGDGLADIASGRYFYRNPGGAMTESWTRIDLGRNVDAVLSLDVDGDAMGDIIAQALPDVYWMEAEDEHGRFWRAQKIGTVEATDHVNSQGFALGQIRAGGKPEILIAGGDGIYCLEIPEAPERDAWRSTRIAAGTSSEGIGVGDIDGDGNLDVAAASAKQDYFAWWKNPGDGSGDWTPYKIGSTPHDGDRFAIAEINGDSRPDIIISEERYPGPDSDANLWWFEQPADPAKPWIKHLIVTEYSLNNLSVADMDRDGDVDVVTCEHKGPQGKFKLQIWENDGAGNFREHLIDQGKESHLGAQLADLDGDGDLDIVSIAWDRWRDLHVWRNDAVQ